MMLRPELPLRRNRFEIPIHCICQCLGQQPLAMRLPKLPGFINHNRVEYAPVNLSRLDALYADGETVDGASLVEKGVIKREYQLVKVLGDGELTKKLTVKVDKVSASAQAKIEAAGGKVEQAC